MEMKEFEDILLKKYNALMKTKHPGFIVFRGANNDYMALKKMKSFGNTGAIQNMKTQLLNKCLMGFTNYSKTHATENEKKIIDQMCFYLKSTYGN